METFAPPEIFRHTVDYGSLPEEMVAAGRFDWVAPEVSELDLSFDRTGTVEFEARYFQFDRAMRPSDVALHIEHWCPNQRWYPARFENIAAHAAAHPDEQRKFAILGLGSIFDFTSPAYRRIPCASRRESYRREFYLVILATLYAPSCRFLAVRSLQ